MVIKKIILAIIVAEKEVKKEKIKEIIEKVNKNLALIEKIKKFLLIK